MDAIYAFDFGIMNWIQENMACGFLDVFFPLVTLLGNGGILCIAASVILFCFKKTRKMGVCMMCALAIGAILVNCILKPCFNRVRPYSNTEWNPLLLAEDLLIKEPAKRSFPSGHANSTFETALVVFFYRKKTGSALLVLSAVICFSRIYLYVHYPTDVLAGIAAGAGAAMLAYFLTERYYGRCEAAVEKRLKKSTFSGNGKA